MARCCKDGLNKKEGENKIEIKIEIEIKDKCPTGGGRGQMSPYPIPMSGGRGYGGPLPPEKRILRKRGILVLTFGGGSVKLTLAVERAT